MFKFFKKKEKPFQEYSIFEIGCKAIYTVEYDYIPTKIVYYKDRIEFSINLFKNSEEEALSDLVPITVIALRTEDRLLPFEIEGVTLFWDTRDMAFRKKVLPDGNPSPLIPSVLIYPNDVLTMEQEFAEKKLSPLALSYATLRDGQYIWYYPDGSIAPAIFEIPRLFSIFNDVGNHPLSAHPVELSNILLTFTPSYMDDTGLSSDNFLKRLSENLKRGASNSDEKNDE